LSGGEKEKERGRPDHPTNLYFGNCEGRCLLLVPSIYLTQVESPIKKLFLKKIGKREGKGALFYVLYVANTMKERKPR